LANSMATCVENDLLTYLCDFEIGMGANSVIDDTLRAWFEEFLAVPSKDPGWKL